VGTIYEILSAPVSPLEIVLGYVGAATTKSIIIGLIILATAGLFVPLQVAHPIWMMGFLVLTSVTFSLLGFVIGVWADGFEKLQLVPLLIITPLTFLGGTFYSISVLPSARTAAIITLAVAVTDDPKAPPRNISAPRSRLARATTSPSLRPICPPSASRPRR
ncbi:hypothetical protein LCGC14_2620700, partial [marine sediment metagenome]